MAVYTRITDDQAASFVQAYNIGDFQRLEPIEAGVENSNYHLFTTQGRFILTLFEKRVDPADLPFFFAFTDHLATHGIRCPQAVPAHNGDIIGHLAGRPAAIISFLKGQSIEPAALTPVHCRELGIGVGQMHRAAQGFKKRRANTLGPEGWRTLAAKIPDLAPDVRGELDWLVAHWPHDLPQSVIHADIFPDNVFFEGDRLFGFIDFYFSCTDFLAYDLALTVNAWCFTPSGRIDPARYEALMAGYQSIRPLTDPEKAAFNTLCRGAAMRILLTRQYDSVFHDPESFVIPKDPQEYRNILEYHCHERLQNC